MRHRFVAVLAAFGLGAAALAAIPTAQAHTDVRIGLGINLAPPPPRFERVPLARPGYVWSRGYWRWSGARYVWMPGVWYPLRAGYDWRAPVWVHVGGRWNFRPGYWHARPVPYRAAHRGYDRGYRHAYRHGYYRGYRRGAHRH